MLSEGFVTPSPRAVRPLDIKFRVELNSWLCWLLLHVVVVVVGVVGIISRIVVGKKRLGLDVIEKFGAVGIVVEVAIVEMAFADQD
nr:hypothetical protein [Tanacetum cinerariifolium]